MSILLKPSFKNSLLFLITIKCRLNIEPQAKSPTIEILNLEYQSSQLVVHIDQRTSNNPWYMQLVVT